MDTANRTPIIDIHTHILPGIDDGARNLGDAEAMLRSLVAQGVDKIILTPHYSADRRSIQRFVAKRQAAFERLCQCPDVDPSKLILASETLLTQSLFTYEDIKPLCINNRYLLIEMPFDTEFTPHICDRILHIIYQFGVIPILAHIERYPYLMRHTKALDHLLDEGVLTQINLSSLSFFFKRNKIVRLIKNGNVHFIGTDCHHPLTRPPEFQRWLPLLSRKVGVDTVMQLLRNAQNILQ